MTKQYVVGEGMAVEIVGEDDTVYCNLSAVDVLDEIHRSQHNLRQKLTKDGRHAEEDEDHPFARFVIRYTEDAHIFETALLILRGYCYSYSFFANGSWRNLYDSKYDLLDIDLRLIERETYSSEYRTDDEKKVGLSNLVRAVQSLHSNDPHNWRKWFIHLVFMFIESARLSPIAASFRASYSEHVDACLACDHTGHNLCQMPRATAILMICELCRERLNNLLQAPVYPIEDLAYHFRGAWGTLSNCLTDKRPAWSLNQDTADKLNLPKNKAQQKTLVMDYVKIVKPA